MHDICACIYDSVRVEGIVRLPNRVWLSIHRYPYIPPVVAVGSSLLNSESSFPLENLKRSKKFEFEKTWRKRIRDQLFFPSRFRFALSFLPVKASAFWFSPFFPPVFLTGSRDASARCLYGASARSLHGASARCVRSVRRRGALTQLPVCSARYALRHRGFRSN